MSRFGNLELDSGHDGNLEQRPVLKDHAYYLAEANTAFECADFEKALRYYSKVLEFDPQQVSAWSGQVRMLIELGEYKEAKLWADKALEHFPRDPELLAAKGVALGRMGELEEALAFSDASIEERGDVPYVWLARGDVLLAREEPRAEYCFDKAQLIAQGSWLVKWLAARIRMFYQQFAQGMKLLQQALEMNPSHFLLWLDLARCQAAIGMTVPAENAFRQARALNPSCITSSEVTKLMRGPSFTARLRRLFS
jgi:tetratricopeptide (TPR) repeat protein